MYMADSQFIVFRLEDQFYGAQIYNIQEIIFPQIPTRIPNNPDFIEGVIDYRDSMVPVLDLKKRFKLGNSDYSGSSRLIIAEVNGSKVAFAVDEVTEILRIDDDQLGDAPEMTKINKEYITGVARLKNTLVVVLDLPKILSVKEQDIIGKI